jgi:mannose-1-phosphate guanylyltransferase
LKAFLLAAGNGTRLRPLTDTTPKCLVPIRGVPMLQIWLQTCKNFGIREILINLHAHADVVREFLEKNDIGLGVHISEEPELLGSAGTLRANREWVAGEDFWVFYADVLNCVDFDAMKNVHRKRKPAATLGLYRVPDPARCGIATVDANGMIQEFAEKPEHPKGNLAFSGLMIGTPQLLDAIPDRVPVDIGFHVLPRLCSRMMAFPISDYLIDIGTMETYKMAQETWPGIARSSEPCVREGILT